MDERNTHEKIRELPKYKEYVKSVNNLIHAQDLEEDQYLQLLSKFLILISELLSSVYQVGYESGKEQVTEAIANILKTAKEDIY